MALYTARLLCPIRDRNDWSQTRLAYLSPALYGDRPELVNGILIGTLFR